MRLKQKNPAIDRAKANLVFGGLSLFGKSGGSGTLGFACDSTT
jgi:hypothetical protein